MTISAEHKLAMWCLPADGRWQSEAQLIAQTKLAARTCGVYAELVRERFCERKVVPILCGLRVSGEFVRMYRRTFTTDRAWWHALKEAERAA